MYAMYFVSVRACVRVCVVSMYHTGWVKEIYTVIDSSKNIWEPLHR